MKFFSVFLTFFLLGAGYLLYLESSAAKKSPVTAELLQEVSDKVLPVTGKIPNWLSGTLVRNGPITVTVNGQTNHHWFDGLAMLHAFSLHDGQVNYTNKFLRSEAYFSVFEDGTINYKGFASDPCRTLFKEHFVFFLPDSPTAIHNANVNVAKYADAYVALTELPLPVRFDIKTLDTLGVLDYKDLLPKNRCWESVHSHYDPIHKQTLNYLIGFGMNSSYNVYSLADGSSERKTIAKISVKEPAYMHSFAVTENYIILTEYPFVVRPLDLIIKGKPFITNFTWKPDLETRFIVINRKNGEVISKSKTKPFFAFHHVNAFEKDNQIHMDIVTYRDASIISGFYINDKDVVYESVPTKLERFSFSPEKEEVSSKILFDNRVEFPRINGRLDGLPYQYVYLVGFGNEIYNNEDVARSQRLYKVDTITNKVLEWSEKGCSPGEPVFVEAPGAKDEDDGVILTVVLDHKNKSSFLLVLDGKDFSEIARSKTPHLIPAGLHGQFFQ